VTTEAHGHKIDDLSEKGVALYARALREGGTCGADADEAPCLLGCRR
jgi:hypothetical protein